MTQTTTETEQCASCGDTECDCIACPECDNKTDGTCDNCSNCSDCCRCSTCDSCNARVESICECCDNCNSCCECAHCSNCERQVESTCSNCDGCERCCECCYCESCDEHVSGDNYCGECSLCNSCCSCSSKVSTRAGQLKFHTAKLGEFKLNPSKRHISLEIEVSQGDSAEMHSTLRKWSDSLVEDCSLPDGGWELNLNPSNGDTFIRHTNAIAQALSQVDADVDTSCGMHCHIDARDFGWLDLFKLCKLYTKVEDGMFRLVARSRRHNHYSEECGDFYNFENFTTFKRDLICKLYGWTPSKSKPVTTYGKTHKHAHTNGNYRAFQERDEKYHSSRYHALNLHSFFYRQTVEFRHHHGTVQATKMQGWGMVCAHVMDAASRMSVKDIDALSGDSLDVLLSILPESLKTWASERSNSLNTK